MKKILISLFSTLFGLSVLSYFLFTKSNDMPVDLVQSSDSVEETQEDTKTTLVNNPETKKVVLEDVTGGDSMGNGYVLRKDGKLEHLVVANLPLLVEVTFYEGWLVRRLPTFDFFSTGVMQEDEDNSSIRYILNFVGDETFDEYKEVVITLETIIDDTPEAHVLEGSF